MTSVALNPARVLVWRAIRDVRIRAIAFAGAAERVTPLPLMPSPGQHQQWATGVARQVVRRAPKEKAPYRPVAAGANEQQIDLLAELDQRLADVAVDGLAVDAVGGCETVPLRVESRAERGVGGDGSRFEARQINHRQGRDRQPIAGGQFARGGQSGRALGRAVVRHADCRDLTGMGGVANRAIATAHGAPFRAARAWSLGKATPARGWLAEPTTSRSTDRE
jgi:hypothetical protein